MQKLLWFGCLGALVVAGVVYLAAHSEKKTDRSLGSQHRQRDCSKLAQFAELGCCIEAEESACTPAMPPQIIDICGPQCPSMVIEHEPTLVPAGAVEVVEEVEQIGLPSEEIEAEQCVMPRCVLPGGIEEAEEIHPPMPYTDDAEEAADDDDMFSDFWKRLFGDTVPSADEPMPTEEESEECQEECDVPACREDPHHSEHYPVCPYTGRSYRSCPSSMPSCPSETPVRGPRCGDGTEQCEPCPKNEADSESPAQPGVDTMEYRPSDAHEGEFEPKPM